MKRIWWPIVALLWPVVLIGAAVLSLATRPYDFESVIALGNQPAWTVTVSYRLNEPWAQVALRMDSMSRWHDVSYRIESSEPWLPRWQGRLQGNLSEFITLMDGAEAPVPMSAAIAKQAARSYTVALEGDGQQRVIDFQSGFGAPAPWPLPGRRNRRRRHTGAGSTRLRTTPSRCWFWRRWRRSASTTTTSAPSTSSQV